MGIQGLLPFIDGAAEDVHISRFTGGRCAIDGYAWLHRGSKTCALEMAKGMATTGFVDFCLRAFLKMRSYGVEPVLVLDGAALPAKAGTEETRRASRQKHMLKADALLKAGERTKALDEFGKAVDITPDHAHQLLLACRRHNILAYVAPYEADAQIAFLARHGHVQLVLAEDSDMMAFGCPAVLYKMDGGGNGRLLTRTRLPDVADASAKGDGAPARLFAPWAEWDAHLFLELCILAGCDYLPSLPGFGIKSAHRALKAHGSVEMAVRVRKMEMREPPPMGWEAYVDAFRRARETFRHQRVFDPAQQRVVPLEPQPVDENGEVAHMPHCGADLPQEVAVALCARGDIHPETHAPFAAPPDLGRRLSAPARLGSGAGTPPAPCAARAASAGGVGQCGYPPSSSCYAGSPATTGLASAAEAAAWTPTGLTPVALPQQTSLRSYLQPLIHKTKGAMRAFKPPKAAAGAAPAARPVPAARSRFFSPPARATDQGSPGASGGDAGCSVEGATGGFAAAQGRGAAGLAAPAQAANVLSSYAYAAPPLAPASARWKRAQSPAGRGTQQDATRHRISGGCAAHLEGGEDCVENAPPQAPPPSLESFSFSGKRGGGAAAASSSRG